MAAHRLYGIDLRILEAIQKDGRITKLALAQKVGLSPTPCWVRLRRLEKAGIVTGYHARVALRMVAPVATVLMEVTLALCAAALELTGFYGNARHAAHAALSTGKATEHFSRMVALLGGPTDFVEKMDQHLTPAPIVRDVFAAGPGIVTAIDTRGVGMAVVALGGGRCGGHG